jgi:thymidylate synthase (FAD)
MVEFMFEISCPQFVATQLHRHRTANINEQSQRYMEVDDVFYCPSNDIRKQSKSNKQGSDDDKDFHNNMFQTMKDVEDLITDSVLPSYHNLVKLGVAKEIARAYLPRALYTKMVYKMDANNLLKFLRLRCAPDAQKETRVYANAMKNLVRPYIPTLIDCLEDSMNSVTIRVGELEHLKNGTIPLSIRRSKELYDKYEKISRRKLVLLIGYRRTGKDTLADALIKGVNIKETLYPACITTLPTLYKPMRLGLADQLKKDVSQMIGYPVTDNNKDKNVNGLTVRDILIQHGTDMRNKDEDYWVNIVLDEIGKNPNRDIIITDCRFGNEITKFKSLLDRDVITVRLYRSSVPVPDLSINSEHELDNFKADHLICDTVDSYKQALDRF